MKSLFTFFLVAFLISCSTDKDNDQDITSNIEGTWVVTELRVDESTASNEILAGAQLLDLLNGMDCEVLKLTFNNDLSVEINDATDALLESIDFTTFEITCPEQLEMTLSTYTYDGATLVVLDENQEEFSVNATIEDDMLLIDAASQEFSDMLDEGQLVFTKQ